MTPRYVGIALLIAGAGVAALAAGMAGLLSAAAAAAGACLTIGRNP